jgi:tetratricopeptide (TPR) repeat protein
MSAIFISHSTKDHTDTEAMASWLQKQGHTSYFIDYDENSGIQAGTDWVQVLYQRLRQCQVVVALVTPNWLESKWCFGEMVLAREKGKPIFPIKTKPCELPGLLSGIQSIDLTVDKESGFRRLAAGLKEQGLDPAAAFELDLTRPPYPGFPAFEEADAAVFFGRSAEILSIRETLEGLRRHSRDVPRLVLVLGSSGSGKSSLVRAGLISRLKKGESDWLPLRPFRPQDELSPLDALAFAIVDTYKDLRLPCDSDLLRRRLRSAAGSNPIDGGELLKIVRELASAVDRREATVLVTIDQAEELVSAEFHENGKTFLQFLGASLSAGDRHLMAVATLRSDSLGVFQNRVASLDSAHRFGLENRPLTVEPIPIERYADLINGPARAAGLEFEDSLVLRLLQDAGQPDSLPLFAFTLRRLYDMHFEGPQANRRSKFMLREYEELGGLAGAVQNAAERIFRERKRTTDEINAFREAFIPGLISYNEDRSYSRRRAFRRELPPEARGLLAGFVDARILVASADKHGNATIEIAHEALLRTWPTLRTWLVEDRDKLQQYNAIVRAAKDWDESGRKSDLLVHRDGRLKDATTLIFERRFSFLPESVEQAYLDACLTNQQAYEAAAQEERERKLRDAQRLLEEQAKRAQAEAKRAEDAEQFATEQEAAASKLRFRALALGGITVLALIFLALSLFAMKNAIRSTIAANGARNQAEDLINFMLFDLLAKLKPIGRLDLLSDVGEKAKEYEDELQKDVITDSRLQQQSVILDHLGDVFRAQGKLQDAQHAYGRSLTIRRKLADQPNAGWQQDLSVSYGYDKVGTILHAQGKLQDALEAYQQSLAIRQKLAKQDKSNAELQRELSVSHDNVGDVLLAQGNLQDALEAYQQDLAIAKSLADQDKSNVGWQQDLSVSYDKVGDVLLKQGKLQDASEAYQQSLAVRKEQADQNSPDTGWQRDLSVSYDKVGDVLLAQGKLQDALEAYRQSLAIRKKLTGRDKPDAGWQRDLSVSYDKVGDVLLAQGKLQDALEAYQQDLAIAKSLADQDKSNVGWQQDLSVSYDKVGDVLLAQGKLQDASQAYKQSLAVRQNLADQNKSNSDWQRDLIVSYYRIGSRMAKIPGGADQAKEFLRTGLDLAKSYLGADQQSLIERVHEALDHISH